MHELSIVQNIIEIVIKEKQNNSAEKVLKISLKIGDFSNIVPETLRFCFDILKNENNLSQTTLEIENVPLRVRCLACGRISGAKLDPLKEPPVLWLKREYFPKIPATGLNHPEALPGSREF